MTFVFSYFTWYDNLWAPPCCYKWRYLMLSKAECHPIAPGHHLFLIRFLLVDKRCFHALATVNSAVMNAGMNLSFLIRIFSRYAPRSGIAGSYGSSISVFKGASTLFSIVAAPTYTPSNNVRGFLFLHTLSSIYYL